MKPETHNWDLRMLLRDTEPVLFEPDLFDKEPPVGWGDIATAAATCAGSIVGLSLFAGRVAARLSASVDAGQLIGAAFGLAAWTAWWVWRCVRKEA